MSTNRGPLRTVAALAVAVVAMALPASAAASFPAARAVLTITGTSSGVDREPAKVKPPQSDCPAQTTEREERAVVHWKAVFKPVVVPLARGPYLSYAPAHVSGGITGGTYGFHDTYLKEAPASFPPPESEAAEPCPTLQSFSATARLGQRTKVGPYWDDEEYAPGVDFGLGIVGGKGLGTFKAEPEELAVPEFEWGGASSELVPVDVPDALPLYTIEPHPHGVVPYATGVILDWELLQPKLAKLRHHGTVRLHVVRHLDNSKRPAPFREECFRKGAHPSCTESMDLNYTITLRWASPARGCDLKGARECLTRPWPRG